MLGHCMDGIAVDPGKKRARGEIRPFSAPETVTLPLPGIEDPAQCMASPGDSDASPLAQAPAESRPSGHTSARKRLSEKDGEAARKRCGRLSVRAEMRAISAAREMSGEAHATRKPMARALEKGR